MSWYRGFENCVSEHVPLSRLTTYRVGGPAEFFAKPADAAALGDLLVRATEEYVPIRLLGHGTNLLVSDYGVSGLVIQLSKNGFGFVNRDGRKLNVGAGHSLPGLVKWSVAQGLSGLECLQGVPGTVGAALRMNAGGKYGEIGNSVRRVRGFERDGTPFDFNPEQCGFVYRNSALGGRIVTECELELSEGDPAAGNKILTEILREKCRTQPVDARSAGCAFKNVKTPGVPPTGKLIDDLGLKGTRVGGALISTLHANFLICENGARAEELAELICMIRQRVYQAHGIMLELEVEVWGFSPQELLPREILKAA